MEGSSKRWNSKHQLHTQQQFFSRSPSPSLSNTSNNSPFADAVLHQQQLNQHSHPDDPLHYSQRSRAEVSRIPIDAVAGPSAGGAAFGDDYALHRSVMAVSRGGHSAVGNNQGGVEVVAPPALPFLPASTATPFSAAYFGGARYSPTGLPLADLAPLKFIKDESSANRYSTGSSSGSISISGNSLASVSPSVKRGEVEDGVGVKTFLSMSNGNSGTAMLEWRSVPALPLYLEPNNHAMLAPVVEAKSDTEKMKFLTSIMKLVERTFARCQVDYVFKADKCKWKAARHRAMSRVDFRCRVYREGGTNTGLVVEFQKRLGDYFLMRDVMESFLAGAEQAGLVRVTGGHGSGESQGSLDHTNTPSEHAVFASTDPFQNLGGSGSAANFLSPPSFGRSFTASANESLLHTKSSGMSADSHVASPVHADPVAYAPDSAVLAPLLEMATGDCDLARLEGVLGLAKLSVLEDNRAVLKDAGAIPILVSIIKHMHIEPAVRQAAVTALSNLSESASCKHPLVEAGVVRSLLRLAEQTTKKGAVQKSGCHQSSSASSTGSMASSWNVLVSRCLYMDLEIGRESARTLANLSEEHAAVMIRDLGRDGVKEFLKSVDSVEDERLRMHARRFKTRMGQVVC